MHISVDEVASTLSQVGQVEIRTPLCQLQHLLQQQLIVGNLC